MACLAVKQHCTISTPENVPHNHKLLLRIAAVPREQTWNYVCMSVHKELMNSIVANLK